MSQTDGVHRPWNVGWTRGQGCQPLAEVLGAGTTTAIRDDLGRACMAERIDLLVARRLSSFDLVPVVVPHGVELDGIEAVTVAVSDGPHSPLAVAVAHRIATMLDVAWAAVTAYRTPDGQSDARERLARLAGPYPSAAQEALETADATAITDRLSETNLLVLGAAGGSWLQRLFFGPGHRLSVTAPGGTIAVRTAPRRCFHALDDRHGAVVGPHMPAPEARRIFGLTTIPVAESGELIGVVRASRLESVGRDETVADVMEAPISVAATEPLSAALELAEFLDGGPVPVTGAAGQLVGVIEVNHSTPLDLSDL